MVKARGDASSRIAVVGGREIGATHFVAAARFLDVFETVLEHLARRIAVVATARRDGAGATVAELQAEADAYRRVLGLHRAQAMTD